ncbi:hypothetical protein PSAC2689_100277 [Paraburkholderia sacchari]
MQSPEKDIPRDAWTLFSPANVSVLYNTKIRPTSQNSGNAPLAKTGMTSLGKT